MVLVCNWKNFGKWTWAPNGGLDKQAMKAGPYAVEYQRHKRTRVNDETEKITPLVQNTVTGNITSIKQA